jgi:hypothetical protein
MCNPCTQRIGSVEPCALESTARNHAGGELGPFLGRWFGVVDVRNRGADETLIYHIWNTNMSDPDMSFSLDARPLPPNIHTNTLLALLQRARIIIGTIRGNVSAANILREALGATRDLRIRKVLLALGPTSPLALGTRHQKIIWATFLDQADIQYGNDPVIVPPTHLTDLSIGFEKLAEKGSVRLLMGDFIDSALLASSECAVFAFLSKLLTRIRENKQTAFFLVTEDMHDAKKIVMVKRFADAVIEYRGTEADDEYGVETRILDYARDHYSDWQRKRGPDMDSDDRQLFQWRNEVGVRP